MTSEIPPAEIFDSLRRMHLLGAENTTGERLTVGVSFDIWRIDLPSGPICVKRALAKLRVAADWRAPVKLLGFNIDPVTGVWQALSGVNITLGLPVIRTSVDHGTAFDIAGTGVANEDSPIEAIDYAPRLAARKKARAAP